MGQKNRRAKSYGVTCKTGCTSNLFMTLLVKPMVRHRKQKKLRGMVLNSWLEQDLVKELFEFL